MIPWVGSVSGKLRRLINAHWPRYVFIHINKTAGSSIERALHLRFEHKTACEKRTELGEWRWNRAFRFTFVRNPWDKVASHYFYRVRTNQTGMGDQHIGFREWVLRAYGEKDRRYYDQPRMFQPQIEWIRDESGNVMVDFIGRFESLERDFGLVTERLAISASLPHVKKTVRTGYQDQYDPETRDCIGERFREDIVRFDYKF